MTTPGESCHAPSIAGITDLPFASAPGDWILTAVPVFAGGSLSEEPGRKACFWILPRSLVNMSLQPSAQTIHALSVVPSHAPFTFGKWLLEALPSGRSSSWNDSCPAPLTVYFPVNGATFTLE